MICWLHLYTAHNCEGNDVLVMCMDDAVHVWESLVYFRVDVSLCISSAGIWIYCASICDVVLDEILWR